MNKVLGILCVAFLCLLPLTAGAQSITYGPYSALSIDRSVVEDALVDGKDLYVKVNEGYWNSEFIVKASAKNGEAFSRWENGTAELPIKVYRSIAKQKQGYTYRISTSGRFVEYWTGGKLVLHLEKVR
jgi:hypothetical protein